MTLLKRVDALMESFHQLAQTRDTLSPNVSHASQHRNEKNYLFCEPCFLSLFRPLFVRYIYRKYPTYISDKLCPKSDQKTRAKQVGYFRLIYRTNCALSRTKKHAQNKSDISDLYIGQIVT